MDRILVIRGGAIGDFILTLPGLKALRDARPNAHIEILGYKHIAVLAENRFYAQAVRSIEYGALARFFAADSELPEQLSNYFQSFDLIVSYLYDPDAVFETNIRRCRVKNLIRGPAKIVENAGHAARQLARPIEQLGIEVPSLSEKVFLSMEDRKFASEFLPVPPRPIVTIHPGSGSNQKNWPVENWIALFSQTNDFSQNGKRFALLVISGEADTTETKRLEREWKGRDVRFAKSLPLPQLAALLEHSVFVGHDSGISHLAAAAGANCVLLFGPTNPGVWAPQNNNVRVLRPQSGSLRDLKVEVVRKAFAAAL